MNARSAAVAPRNRHFFYFESEFSRQEKNFRIESPALDFLQRKNRVDGGPLERLEPALRIGKMQAKREPEQEIKNASEDLPVQRLALGLHFGTQPARSDGDISSGLERSKKLGRFFNG